MNIRLKVLTFVAKKIDKLILNEKVRQGKKFSSDGAKLLKKLDNPKYDPDARLLKLIYDGNAPEIISGTCSNGGKELNIQTVVSKIATIQE